MPNHPQPSIDAVLQTATDIDLEMRRLYVIVNVLFRNTNCHPVENPHIILHVSPSHISTISGKVVPPKLVQAYGLHTKDGKQWGWKFAREDWFIAGHKSGEYVIEPVHSLILTQGVWMEMRDVYIECDIDRLRSSLQVHAFIIAAGEKFPVVNPTSVSFSAS